METKKLFIVHGKMKVEASYDPILGWDIEIKVGDEPTAVIDYIDYCKRKGILVKGMSKIILSQ